MSEAQVRDFISRVVPWPGEGTPGFVNIHWKSPSPRDPNKDFWGGRPVRSVNDFLWWVNWALKRPSMKDIYFCTSMQKEAGKNHKGNPSVIRSKDLAVSLKAIWLDVDVKAKGYETLDVALAAVADFVAKSGLPPPSALVATGGGLHVYWISNTPLVPDDWQPYAEGLKALAIQHGLQFDASVTADSARILRVPDTFNHKETPLRPVRVLGLRDKTLDYDFSASLGMLPKIAPVQKKASFKFINGEAPMAAGFASLKKESLSDGLDRYEELPPLDWEPIAVGCRFIGDALRTGGADYTQPMWNLSTLAATFMENGQLLAHAMGKSHPGYTRESTDALWDRKNRERKDRGLGWPSCAAIQASGCGACASCPHFAKGKSPLNLAPLKKVVTPTGSILVGTETGQDIQLPVGYALNDEGVVCKVATLKGKQGEPLLTELVPLFHCKVLDAWITDEPKELSILITVGKDKQGRDKTDTCSIKLGKLLAGKELWGSLQSQGMTPIPRRKDEAENFLMAFLAKLQNEKDARQMVPFGWWVDGGKRKGFVYGGLLMKDDKTQHPSSAGDSHTRALYKPHGTIEPWFKALNMIHAQKRPALEAIVASAFAGPLIASTGEKSGFLSAYGPTGKGKSSAMGIGQAVWGHAKRAKQATNTTANSTIGRAGAVKNLTLFWDEVREEESYKNVYSVLFSLYEGIEKGRMNADSSQREQGDWQTLITVCSNHSFVDYVVKRAPSDEAGLYRCFEIRVEDPGQDYPGKIDGMEASRMLQDLEHNYGMMGLEYSKLLGQNPEGVDQLVTNINDRISTALAPIRQEERFWRATCVSLISGAILANQIGCNFDVQALENFLIDSFVENRRRIEYENTAGGSVDNTEELLTNFLKYCVDETVYTSTFPQGKGQPGIISVLFGPNPSHPKPINVQFAVNDKMLRISRKEFLGYLAKDNISPAHVLRGLKEHFEMEEHKAKLAGGTQYRCGQERLLHIPIKDGTTLHELMLAHNNNSTGEAA